MPYDASLVSDTVIAHKKGLTLQLLRGLRDNAIALVKGEANAPVNQAMWHPYDMVTIGDGADGVIFDHSADGTVASITTPDFEDGYEYRFIGRDVDDNDLLDLNAFRIELYQETDAAWGTAQTLYAEQSVGGGSYINFDIVMLAPRLALRWHYTHGIVHENTEAAVTSITGHFDSTAQKILRARFSYSGASINAGVIRMLRRRAEF